MTVANLIVPTLEQFPTMDRVNVFDPRRHQQPAGRPVVLNPPASTPERGHGVVAIVPSMMPARIAFRSLLR